MKTIMHDNGVKETIEDTPQGELHRFFHPSDGRQYDSYIDITSRMDLSPSKHSLLDHVYASMMD